MFFANNVLAHHLRNVYWILGTPCGGKSTIAALLTEKCGALHYQADEKVVQHKALANPAEQPALCRYFEDWEAYFGQPIKEYSRWLRAVQDESMSIVIVDLLKMSEHNEVVFEGLLDIEAVISLTGYQRIVFLGATAEVIRASYFDREDKADMHSLIRTLRDPAGTCKKVLDLVVGDSERDLARAQKAGLKVIIRDKDSSIIETLQQVQTHFGLKDIGGVF